MRTHQMNLLLHDTIPEAAIDGLFGRLVDDFLTGDASYPETHFEETGDQDVIEVAVPGMSRKDLKLRLEENVLYLTQTAQPEKAWRNESVSRSFVLPRDADPGRIKARCRNGLLSITVPKQKPVHKALQIPVHGAERAGLHRAGLHPRNLLKEVMRRLRGSQKQNNS